jgi:hypothetical protein
VALSMAVMVASRPVPDKAVTDTPLLAARAELGNNQQLTATQPI